MNDDTKISWPIGKVISLWMAIGVTSWAEAASFAAFVYSMILIGEWAWKKIKAARQREAS